MTAPTPSSAETQEAGTTAIDPLVKQEMERQEFFRTYDLMTGVSPKSTTNFDNKKKSCCLTSFNTEADSRWEFEQNVILRFHLTKRRETVCCRYVIQ